MENALTYQNKIQYCLMLPATAEQRGLIPATGFNQPHWQNRFRSWALFFKFPLVYNPYCRQVVGKIFLTIGQFAHKGSSGYDTDTPSTLFWAVKRLSQVLAETVESSVQQQKVAGIVVSLSRFLLFLSFPQDCHYLAHKWKAHGEKRAKLTKIHIYAFVMPSKVLKRTIPF